MAGPFAGLTVVEFGQFVAVPFCGQLLADAGARVIKIEPLDGDPFRNGQAEVAPGLTRAFLNKNRGKQSVSLDLSHPDSVPIVEDLVRLADIVLVNLSPEAVKRRGLDYERVAELNAQVIYGAVTAFGQVGPEASLPGMDVVVQARSGMLTALAAEEGGVPLHSEVQLADHASSLLLFGGIAAALYTKATTGKGQRVDVSLLGGALALQNSSLSHLPDRDTWRDTFVHETLPVMRSARAPRATIERERAARRPDPTSYTAHYRAFATKDGHLAVGASPRPKVRSTLARILGIDERLALGNQDEFGAEIKQAMLARTNDEWVSALQDAGIPVAPVTHIEEIFYDRHARAEGLIADYDHPVVGRFRGLGVPIRMSETPLGSGVPAPSFAQHTPQVLKELGYSDRQILDLAESRAIRIPH